MRIDWQAPRGVYAGNAFGYSKAREALRSELMRLGVRFDESAPVALHIHDPMQAAPVPGKRNALLTMWDSPELPEDRIRRVAEFDLVVVPSRFCERVFAPYARRIIVSPLGVDVGVFRYVRREPAERRPFIWLFAGGPNERKGGSILDEVWQAEFAADPSVALYVKTTGAVVGDRAVRAGNVIVDGRTLDEGEMARLYQEADGFVAPTLGEGWGLMILEAMATGLPVVVTAAGGHLDFCSPSNSFLVAATPGVAKMKNCGDREWPVALPSVQDLVRKMRAVQNDHRRALVVGRRAARSVAHLTWEHAARSLAAALRSV